ncbi:winged helix-turn-helix domain-containing protein [Endozoicomonas sp. YOMI1]|uniref:winged helix-turn-helix domain-containing protein n=1 Tax=Endozoicomonas sp. YOMI1 TaxID=2828739 RepID=UPI0021481241|nr:winged helix-turn-helix domain-containing protein [Endozoicomonas sp. YOMI1]
MTTIASALFTKTQQRLLSELYGKPDTSFYLNELVRLAGTGKGAVVREVKKMTEAGILVTYQQGNQQHYQANPGNPVFEELRAITRKTFGIKKLLTKPVVKHRPIGPGRAGGDIRQERAERFAGRPSA